MFRPPRKRLRGFSFYPTFAPMSVTVNLNINSDKANLRQIEYVQFACKIIADYQKLHKFEVAYNSADKDSPGYYEARRNYLLQKRKCFHHPIEISYGGGIRGGKTFGALAILIILCKAFPKSRWGVVRKSMPAIQNAINSTKKVIANSPNVYWKLGQKESFVQFDNGSRIYFLAENYAQDKQHTKFLGMEMNGFLFEQLEEITEAGFNMIKSRAGSWYNVTGAMPPPLILTNFNPTFGWVKKYIYDSWRKGELKWYQKYFPALAKDNPFVTPEQWRMWSTLDADTKARMIDGEWDIEVKKAFLHSFKADRHVKRNIEVNWNDYIYLSFDFNVDPMTCVLFQTDGRTYFRVPLSWKEANSDTYALCRKIKPLIQGKEHLVRVTGDASGKNRISGTDGAINQYQIIQQELGLKTTQFILPKFNPPISDRRVLSNSVIEHIDDFCIDERNEALIKDCQFTTVSHDVNGDLAIDKKGINEYTGEDNRLMGHLMDCLTYGIIVKFHDFVKIPKS